MSVFLGVSVSVNSREAICLGGLSVFFALSISYLSDNQKKCFMNNSFSNRISLVRGDITRFDVDAIVNAANSSLMGGGGVDGAIHRAGGPAILEECREIVARQGHCETGNAVITSGGNLPAKFVIHTVGPVWHGGFKNEAKLLENAYLNSLNLAVTNGIKTIAFPNISTGVYSYPKEQAAKIAIRSVVSFLLEDKLLEQVYMVCFDLENYEIYKRLLHL